MEHCSLRVPRYLFTLEPYPSPGARIMRKLIVLLVLTVIVVIVMGPVKCVHDRQFANEQLREDIKQQYKQFGLKAAAQSLRMSKKYLRKQDLKLYTERLRSLDPSIEAKAYYRFMDDLETELFAWAKEELGDRHSYNPKMWDVLRKTPHGQIQIMMKKLGNISWLHHRVTRGRWRTDDEIAIHREELKKYTLEAWERIVYADRDRDEGWN